MPVGAEVPLVCVQFGPIERIVELEHTLWTNWTPQISTGTRQVAPRQGFIAQTKLKRIAASSGQRIDHPL